MPEGSASSRGCCRDPLRLVRYTSRNERAQVRVSFRGLYAKPRVEFCLGHFRFGGATAVLFYLSWLLPRPSLLERPFCFLRGVCRVPLTEAPPRAFLFYLSWLLPRPSLLERPFCFLRGVCRVPLAEAPPRLLVHFVLDLVACDSIQAAP
jgi:hypothetical protein